MVTLNPWPSPDASQGSAPTPSWVRTGESPGIPQDPSLSFGFQQHLSGTSEGQGTNGKTEPRAPRQIQPWVQHQGKIIRAPCPFQRSGCCCYPCPPLLSPSSLSSTKSVTELTQNSGQVPNVIPGANRVQDEHRTEEQKEEARREGDAQGPALWVRTPRKTAATASPVLPSIYQSPSSSSFGVSKTIKHGEHREQLQNTVLNTGKKIKWGPVGSCHLSFYINCLAPRLMVLCRLLYWLFALQHCASTPTLQIYSPLLSNKLPRCPRMSLCAPQCRAWCQPCQPFQGSLCPGTSHGRGTNSPDHHRLPKSPWASHSPPHLLISWCVKSSFLQSRHLPKQVDTSLHPGVWRCRENRERGTST